MEVATLNNYWRQSKKTKVCFFFTCSVTIGLAMSCRTKYSYLISYRLFFPAPTPLSLAHLISNSSSFFERAILLPNFIIQFQWLGTGTRRSRTRSLGAGSRGLGRGSYAIPRPALSCSRSSPIFFCPRLHSPSRRGFARPKLIALADVDRRAAPRRVTPGKPRA